MTPRPIDRRRRAAADAWLDHPRQAARPRLDPGGRARSSARCAQGGYGKVKVGHGGTLDPLATGVLPIAIGEATKLAGRMLDSDKVYEFTIGFGVETDTLDLEGEVDRDERRAADAGGRSRRCCRASPGRSSRCRRPIRRSRSMASAPMIWRGRAKRWCWRAGVTVHALTVTPAEPGSHAPRRSRRDERGSRHKSGMTRLDAVTLTAHVSKGTYIRSLARDIALRARHRRPCHHAPPHQGRAVHPRSRDIAGQTGRTRLRRARLERLPPAVEGGAGRHPGSIPRPRPGRAAPTGAGSGRDRRTTMASTSRCWTNVPVALVEVQDRRGPRRPRFQPVMRCRRKRMSITAERKEALVKEHARAEGDTGQPRSPGRDPHRAHQAT